MAKGDLVANKKLAKTTSKDRVPMYKDLLAGFHYIYILSLLCKLGKRKHFIVVPHISRLIFRVWGQILC